MGTKAVERLRRKLTLENLWIYIVRILGDEPGLKAYDVKKRLRDRYGIKPATVTVYTTLYKMTREKLLETRDEGGDKRYYVTEKGAAALEEAKKILREVLEKIS